MRLGRHQPGQVIGEGRVTAAGPAELGPGARVDLLVHRVVWLAFNHLAGGEAEGLGAGSPPAAGRFPILGGVDVVAAGRVRRAGLGLSLPDIAEVVALGDGDDHGQPAAFSHRDRGAAGPTMIIYMNATVCGDRNHGEQKAVHDRLQRPGEEDAVRQEKGQRPGEERNFRLYAKVMDLGAREARQSVYSAGAYGLWVAESSARSASSIPRCQG